MLNGEPAFNRMELALLSALVPPAYTGNVSRSDLLPIPPRCQHHITSSKIPKHILLGLGEQASERKVITKYATLNKHTYIYNLPHITKLHTTLYTNLSLSSLPYEIGSEMSQAFVTKHGCSAHLSHLRAELTPR